MKKVFLLFCAVTLCFNLLAQPSHTPALGSRNSTARYGDIATAWIDSVMASMSLEQQIAQLMIIRVPLNMDDKAMDDFCQLIQQTEVGGVCFFVGTAERTLPMIRRFQSISCVPLLVCIDAEWGLGMRLKDCYSFPRNSRFGLLPAEMDTLVYMMGAEIGRECRNMGIHVNFAPVADVNSNPANPVIGTRSFGNDPERVAQLAIQFMRGQQSQGVMAVAKHFPGHGDTDADSHFDLPVIRHSRGHLDSVELVPFARLIDAGVEGVMTAHLHISAYETEAHRPSSLSANVVNGLLRQRMGFQGMVITDGLDMKGVTKYFSDGQGEYEALLAGSDLLLLPPDVPAAIRTIARAADNDENLRTLVEMRCRRVLRAKYNHGCAQMDPDRWHIPGRDDSLRCAAITQALRAATETQIDSIVQDGIARQAYPGCQVMALQDGHLLFHRNYGHLTYAPGAPKVTDETVYDLASVTKMLATTLAVMKLVETEKVRLDDPLSRYLPYLKRGNKEKITIRQALSHVAGLKDFDAYWKTARFSDTPYEDIIEQIAASPVQPGGNYVYSDLGFILLGELVRYVSGQSLDVFVHQHFYEPMGLCHTHFNPIENGIDSLSIAPTESDNYYRHCIVQGSVHDPNAYAMGGVSGHAGLFSNAADVAKLLQMLLDGGVYDGRRLLKEQTIQLFNSRSYAHLGCRRGLGFDKPLLSGNESTACAEASQSSYGHTGFTGTMVWVDPEYKLVFLFLSNRVHPKASPNKLAQMNIRTQVHHELYKVLAPAVPAGGGVATFGNVPAGAGR